MFSALQERILCKVIRISGGHNIIIFFYHFTHYAMFSKRLTIERRIKPVLFICVPLEITSNPVLLASLDDKENFSFLNL